MFTHILVPIDFSASSAAALVHARGLARTFGASLHLLHVAESVFLRAMAADPRDHLDALRRQLAECITDGDRRAGAPHVSVERSDEPADEIVRYARQHEVDLVAMGTHGRSGLARAVMGSVAERVVRTAHCPVLTVREPRRRTAPARVLVAIDFSPPSDVALEYARMLASRFGAALRILHVVDDPTAGGPLASEMYLAASPVSRTERLRETQARLAQRVLESDRTERHAKTEVLFGRPAETIAHYAADNGADLIVIGTHGRTGAGHLLFGSVAGQVVRQAACPVLTVREARGPVFLPAAARTNAAAR